MSQSAVSRSPRLALARLLVLGLGPVLLVGCAGEDQPPATPTDNPPLGGVRPTATPPLAAMDELEQPIARQLAARVADQGLHVDGLQCPEWERDVPAELDCEGWFDGVQGTVRVELRRSKDDEVAFDARLTGGVIATKNLVDELVSKGYDEVDCGDAPAYPTAVGSTITCAVTTVEGTAKYVVATVTDEHGGVTIKDFSR